MHFLPQVRSIARGIVMLAILLASGATLVAQVPRELTYQGILRTTGGILQNGLQNIQFSLFTVPVGGAAIWTEPHVGINAVNVTNGLFTTRLGVITPFPVTLDFANQYWLEIEYPVGTPLSPRTQLAASPYAIHAALADAIPGAYQWTLAGGYLFPSSPNTNAPLALGGTGAPPPGAGRLNVWGNLAEPTIVRLEGGGVAPGNFNGITYGILQANGSATGIEMPQVQSNGSTAAGIRLGVNGNTAAWGVQAVVTSAGPSIGYQAAVSTTGANTATGVSATNGTPAGNPQPQYGVDAIVPNASIGAAVRAVGAGTAGPGAPNAAALELVNGAFNITGATQAAGTVALVFPIAQIQCITTVNNPLVTNASRILVTVEDASATIPGNPVQVFAATVSGKQPGQFFVNVYAINPPGAAQTCTGIPATVTHNIRVHYLIIGP